MAFPVVETTATSISGGVVASFTVSLPSGIVSGDLLIVAISFNGEEGDNPGWPVGWTTLGAILSNAAGEYLSVAYRKADGTEGSSIAVTGASFKAASAAWRISGAVDPVTQAPERSAGIANSSSPDTDLLTPTGGAKDYLWLSVIADGAASVSTAPTNYSNLLANQQQGGATSTWASIGGAQRQLNASSENPGAFTVSAADQWAGVTLAIHPAGPTDDPANLQASVAGDDVTLTWDV